MKLKFVAILIILSNPNIYGQLCGTPGIDGPSNIDSVVNTYFPAGSNIIIQPGSDSIKLLSVPLNDTHGNSFGSIAIQPGDLIMFIQIQDAIINTSNSNLYGSGIFNSGPDFLGGTGFTSIENSGLYEYVIAENTVSLSGGILHFKGTGASGGVVNRYENSPGDGISVGKKTFQVIRVPQYSSITLTSDIVCPPFNGSAGGIIAFDVAGDFNFNNHSIDASAKGFRGGYEPIEPSDCTDTSSYTTIELTKASGKGEGIAGTPRFMWDGYNEVDNGNLWVGSPGASFGKGAPANAGGGGCDHNAGGGGGGNNGAGGKGANGTIFCFAPGQLSGSNGGRPGINISTTTQRLIMGGGGGGGDANDALTGTKGGVGGGIIAINAGKILGNGSLFAKGSNGQRGVFNVNPDGAGGGGAGGTIFINVSGNSNNSVLTILANGGEGGNTVNDLNIEHGPGGGGGGGTIWHNVPGTTVTASVLGGANGLTNDGGTGAIQHGATYGQNGVSNSFLNTDLTTYLQSHGPTCFPILSVFKSELHAGINGSRPPGNQAIYTIDILSSTPGGGAGGIIINDPLPNGFRFDSAQVQYFNGSTGPVTLQNSGSVSNPKLGIFRIPDGGSIKIKMYVFIQASVQPGVYQNGTQVLYLDPTRTNANPNRLITPLVNSILNQNTVYESGTVAGIPVTGQNYTNNQNGPILEDVHVINPGAISPNMKFCESNDIQLTVIPPAYSAPFQYNWNGPGLFSPSPDVQSPKVLNAQISNAGVYTVTITDANGFISTYSSNITINSKLALGNDTLINLCQGKSLYLDTLYVLAATSYSWTHNNLVVPPASAVSTAGSYQLISINASGCPDTALVTVTVVANPVVVTHDPPPGCAPQAVDLTVAEITAGTTAGLVYTYWTNAAATIPCNNPTTTESGMYYIKGTDGNGCTDIRPVTVAYYPLPVVNAGDDLAICDKGSTTLNATVTNITAPVTYQWEPVAEGNISSPAAATTVVKPAATQQYILTVKDGYGCNYNVNDTITVTMLPPVPAFAGNDTNAVVGLPHQLLATGGVDYIWSPGSFLDNAFIANPLATLYADNTIFTVIVKNIAGCVGYDTVWIKAFEGITYYVPNAFSPNGDTKNDVFRPVPVGIVSTEFFRIFNRYGGLVFETTQWMKGWDGYYKGKPQPTGNYVWVIKGNGRNGRSIEMKGNVVLIR